MLRYPLLGSAPARLMRLILCALVVLSFQPFGGGQAALITQTSSPKERAQALLETLRPEERIGQLFLVTFSGPDAAPGTQIHDLIVNHHVGGVVLLTENDNFTAYPQTLSDLLRLTRQIQSDEWSASQKSQVDVVTNEEFTPAFIPILVAISQEGDGFPYDQLFNGLTPLPSEMALGATWDPALARSTGQALGRELSALGINFLLGPSLDVLYAPQSLGPGDLGVRSFGGDPYWVSEMGKAYVSGLHEGSAGRIAVVAKHFPGHGGSNRLPEEEIATIRKSLAELTQVDLPPFYAVTGEAPTAAATVDGLVAAHIRYQGFQGNIRETTRPVSLDPQAYNQLMSLPAIASWRDAGGLMVSDNLGSRAFRRFSDPTERNFNAPIVARDAFLPTGNDLLFLGREFVATTDTDIYTTTVRTLNFFTRKYNEDPAFQQRVDESVLRVLTLKYRLYNNIFTLNQTQPPVNSLLGIGVPEHSQITFQVAQAAATLISPSLADLAEAIPEPPGLNDRIVFFTDALTAQQCSECLPQPVFAENALEQAVVRLYGPFAGGQVLQRNLESYSFTELQALLDTSEGVDVARIEANIQQADWIIFSILQVSSTNPASRALSRFLAEQPALYRQKRLIVFAFNSPYRLDQTEVSKITAFYGLYSKTPQFVDVAARVLFGELPAPPGALPVSVPGVGYDLISTTAPDPAQIIPLILDYPEPAPIEGTATAEPTPAPLFEINDLIPIRTGVIQDHNRHQVPDGTPVLFTLRIDNETVTTQTESTIGGVARTTFLIDRSGTVEISVESEPAKSSDILRFDIPPQNGEVPIPSPTTIPTETPTPSPTPTPTSMPEATPTPSPPAHTGVGDWFLAVFATSAIAGLIYWLTAQYGVMRWGIRGGFLALIGGMIAYTYLALGMPGSVSLLENAGSWGVLLFTILGAGVGWGATWGWQRLESNLTKGKP